MTRRNELLQELREARDAAMSPIAGDVERRRLEDAIVAWRRHVEMGKRIADATSILEHADGATS